MDSQGQGGEAGEGTSADGLRWRVGKLFSVHQVLGEQGEGGREGWTEQGGGGLGKDED